MKKIIALMLAGAMVLGFTACGAEKEKSKENVADTSSETVIETKAEKESYTVKYNMNDGNTSNMATYQFLGADFSGLINYDSRLYINITLDLDGEEHYELTSDCYVVEAGQRQEVGGETGIGQTWIMTAEGTYVNNGDGTITTSAATSASLKVATDTYSSQMKEAVAFAIEGASEDGEWNSTDTTKLLEYIPETIFTVKDGAIVSYMNPNATENEEVLKTETTEDTEAEKTTGNVMLEIPSDDQGTLFTLFEDGIYSFVFEEYDITDNGTYSYEDGVLTITDKNGVVTTSTVEEENIKFHYAYSDSSQLVGDYTIKISDLEAALN